MPREEGMPRYMSLATLAFALDVGESTIEAWVAMANSRRPSEMGPASAWGN
jgi:hypothetical protein